MAENSSNSGLLEDVKLRYIVFFLKGIAMGLGDSVPGVSGLIGSAFRPLPASLGPKPSAGQPAALSLLSW